ncbi:MAG: glycosyltransferase [Planctomycetes bacterium]|nr:glycosyltransferase [Planctomycetota bacterium]
MSVPRLLVLVPCRNESLVIERRVANLARAAWPEGTHRVVIVDDGSDDGTRAAAERALHAHADRLPTACCVDNRLRPGKAGAIASALDEFEDEADVVLLTDADVVQDEGALVAIARAFEADSRLGMACGAQRFVHELAADGAAPPDARDAGPAAAPFDRWTAAVRRFESRRGCLFSVHGQLLAWRAGLGLQPRPEIAADDLDLSLALRRARPDLRIELLQSAVFFEAKPRAGADAEGQALRRARAWVQALDSAPPVPGVQAWCYRRLPLAAPRLAALLTLAFVLACGWLLGAAGALVAGALLVLALLTPVGRHVLRLLIVIERARHAERREPLSTRWEMQR